MSDQAVSRPPESTGPSEATLTSEASRPRPAGVPDSVAAWEERYSSEESVWSGNPNAALVATVGEMTPGRVLDVGCGEGADVIWLAEHGWDATGVDLSATAIDRAKRVAADREVSVDLEVADISTWAPADEAPRRGGFDLVVGCFLHTRLPDTREELLARVAAQVGPGGGLLLISHATMPPWAEHDEKLHNGLEHHHERVSPNGDYALLIGASPDRWEIELAEIRTRQVTSPDGEPAELEDSVLLARRIVT